LTQRAASVAVVGVGSPDRGDDGAGPAVARRVERAVGGTAGVTIVAGTDPLHLLDAVAGVAEVHVVDACRSGAPPGTVHRLDATAGAGACLSVAGAGCRPPWWSTPSRRRAAISAPASPPRWRRPSRRWRPSSSPPCGPPAGQL
jgi:hypothetical protein